MKLSNFEEYLEYLDSKPDAYRWPKKNLTPEKEKRRKEIHKEFPFFATTEGNYLEHDALCSWLWENFGPRHGLCEEHAYDDEEVKIHCPIVLDHKRDSEGERLDLEEHSHEGVWTTFWCGKTGYDYGFNDFCFSTKEMMEKFIEKVKLDYEGEHRG